MHSNTTFSVTCSGKVVSLNHKIVIFICSFSCKIVIFIYLFYHEIVKIVKNEF